MVSLYQWLDTLQFHFVAPLVSLLQRGLQDKEQIKQLGSEVEFVVRYAAMIGGRNLELVQVCLSKVGWGYSSSWPELIPSLVGSRECLEGCLGVEGGFFGFCTSSCANHKIPRMNTLRMRFVTSR